MSGARGSSKELVLVLGLVLIETVPAAAKAFHIDDAFFIAVARNVQAHPLRPFAGAVALDDTDQRVFTSSAAAPNTFATLSHPPLVPYLIAGVAWWVGGFRELPEHLAFIPFALLAVAAQYALARRLDPSPRWATLLLATSPIFVVSAHSVMTDVPALALFLSALALFVAGLEADKRSLVLLSGVVAGLAVLTRYVALGLLPLGAAWVLTHHAPGRFRRSLLALAPLGAVVVLWLLQNRVEHGQVHLAASTRHYLEYYGGRYAGITDLGRRAVTDLVALGLTGVPVAAAVVSRLDRKGVAMLLACAAAALIVVVLDPFQLGELAAYGEGTRAAVVLGLALGALLVARAATQASGPDGRFLLFWLVGGLLGTIGLLPFGASRYMLLILPPLFLLLCRAGEGEAAPLRRPRAAVIASAALSLALAAADQEYSGVYRDLARRLPAITGDQRVFFIGDWGFRFYMEDAGHRYLLSSDESPAAGDFVVRPQVAGLHEMAPGLARRARRVVKIEVPGTIPVRIMSHEAHAGFYSHGWGLLPFAFSSVPLERFEVFRVTS